LDEDGRSGPGKYRGTRNLKPVSSAQREGREEGKQRLPLNLDGGEKRMVLP